MSQLLQCGRRARGTFSILALAATVEVVQLQLLAPILQYTDLQRVVLLYFLKYYDKILNCWHKTVWLRLAQVGPEQYG